ncbi:Flavonoid glucosyltransferase, family GT1 [Zostera marina]|uniref:Glycosyltransferase n=1 Tax=Zostera marina TaxID=29655 RepID=A0A0K9NV44_ZOSMR|nr:Flavonoid glucosyltransferase, family GT1 [Zostera marina]
MKDPVKEWIEKEKMGVYGDIPICMVSDYCQTWTRNIASELGLVRFVFNCIGSFPSLCEAILQESYGGIGEEEATDNRKMVIKGIPDNVTVTKAEVPGFFPKGTSLYDEFLGAYETSDGIILNSFTELEPEYIKLFETFKGKKVWPLGPVGLINRDITEQIHRGTTISSTVMNDRLLNFLNSKPDDSVIYLCMGSLARLSLAQVIEIGLGLEESGHPFVWAIKTHGKSDEVESWLKESRFEKRNQSNGFIIKEYWVPQVMILSHLSVGGFLTHCGWNSSMEGITAGVPMLTWPCFFDQFLNAKFLVNVLKIGVMVRVKEPTLWWDEISGIERGEIEKSVKELMGCSEEAVMRRKRANELKILAEKAMGVDGSTQNNLDAFVHEAFSLVKINISKKLNKSKF